MHIPVNDILAQEVGYQTSFEVADEQPELGDVLLARPLGGTVEITRLSDGLGLYAKLSAAQILECHRCLQPYILEQFINLGGEFSGELTNDDQWPIEKDLSITLDPLVRQEMILATPLKQLCKSDCRGLNPETGQPYEPVTVKDTNGSTKETQN